MVRFGELRGAALVRARPAPLCGADGSELGQVRGAQIGGRLVVEFLDNQARRYCSASPVFSPDLDDHERQPLRELAEQHNDWAGVMRSWRITGATDDAIAYMLPGGPPDMDRRSRRDIDFRVTRTLLPDDPLVALVRRLDITTPAGETVTQIRVHRGGWRKDIGYGIECSPTADGLHRKLGLALAWLARDGVTGG